MTVGELFDILVDIDSGLTVMIPNWPDGNMEELTEVSVNVTQEWVELI